MARMVQLKSLCFRTVGEATAYYKEMLNRYPLGAELSAVDAAHLYELLERHPEAADKIGRGVAAIYVAGSPDHATRCFWIRRVDGTRIDFSYKAALRRT